MTSQFSRVGFACLSIFVLVATCVAKDKEGKWVRVYSHEKLYVGVSAQRGVDVLKGVAVHSFSSVQREPGVPYVDFVEQAHELQVEAVASGTGLWCADTLVHVQVYKTGGAKFERLAAVEAVNAIFAAVDKVMAPEQAVGLEKREKEAKRFAGIQSALVGMNVRALVSLPVWTEGGRREFPSGRNLKPGEVGTISAVGMFRYYPLPATDILATGACGRDSRSRSLVLFLNGAQARVLPPKIALPGRDLPLEAVAESLDTFLSIAGGPLTSIQAQQRQQMREQERTTEEQRLSRLEAGQREAERAYNDGGPEIVIRLDADEQVPSLAKLVHWLRELVQFEPLSSHPTSR